MSSERGPGSVELHGATGDRVTSGGWRPLVRSPEERRSPCCGRASE